MNLNNDIYSTNRPFECIFHVKCLLLLPHIVSHFGDFCTFIIAYFEVNRHKKHSSWIEYKCLFMYLLKFNENYFQL